ncbi:MULTISPECIES: hypothetical protein [unclassified Thiocapsa]|uniref:hypothetical protein n=1 Tax=unclassified Thiocapsa TaxID=2641286 RepID=UPI0035ADC52D
MIHTLFIDESGDFEQDPRWIVSGVLCEGKPSSAEKRLKDALDPLPRQFRLSSRADLHLTELRTRLGHQLATQVAKAVFTAAGKTGCVTAMLVVENRRRRGLRESERTYRLMLLDLLALADSALPEAWGSRQLEVIVARRQKQGELMSTRDELLSDVVERIEDAVEAGLAARGLLERLDARHVRIWPAAESAGLVLADFAANLSYNRHQHESGALYGMLERDGRLSLFEGFGGYAERRARIAERDGDLATALARWCVLDREYVTKDSQDAALLRLWTRIMVRGSTGPMATLEAALERLWRQHQDPATLPILAGALDRLEKTLPEGQGSSQLLFRLRNLMHLVANQIGDIATADRIIASQGVLAEAIATDPNHFHLVLDMQLLQTVTEELRLNFVEAIRLARSHCDLVEQYRAVWELLAGHAGGVGFTRSRVWCKAQMTLIRTLLLAGGANNLREADDLLETFPDQDVSSSDLARLGNYRVWADVRCRRLESALGHARAILDCDAGIFATQFAARAAADSVIEGHQGLIGEARAMLRPLRERSAKCSGHPGDLVWRDMGVLEWHVGSGKKAALECMERSLKITGALPLSPANAWIRHVTEVHLAELRGGEVGTDVLPEAAVPFQQDARALAKEIGPLRAYRAVSPY